MRKQVRDTTAPFARYDNRIGWPLTDAPQLDGVLPAPSGLQLGVAGAKPISDTEHLGSLGGRRAPKGLAISTQGRAFVADPIGRTIQSGLANPPGDTLPDPRLTPLWPARALSEIMEHDLIDTAPIPSDPYTLVRPVDVALTPAGDLAIVDEGAQRIVVLAFPTAYVRQVINFADHAPTAIVFDRHNAAHVLLLPITDGGTAELAKFDGNWRRDHSFPHHSLAMSKPSFLAAWPNDHCGCDTGCACASSSSETSPLLVVLDRTGLVAIGEHGRAVFNSDIPTKLSPPPLTMGADRTLLYDDPTLPNHDPLQLTGMTVNALGLLEGTNLGLIALPRRIELPRYGTVITAALDSETRAFAWDRIALDLTLPVNTRMLVSSLTSDSALEPDRVREAPDWSAPLELLPDQTPEILIQSGSGRYLWLRLEFFGDGSVSPLIAQADVFGPRRSSLHDLPALFQQDADSANFLDRFLSYFDTGLDEIAGIGQRIPALLDPYATDPEFITWLGSWFDLEFQSNLPEATRREMIAQAIPYFRQRGTVDGLRRILQWHTGLTGDLPQVIEHYRLTAFETPPVVAGEPLGNSGHAHRFSIVVPHSVVPNDAAFNRLQRLIAVSIPAHTGYDLITLSPGVAIGTQSTIGVDMLLGAAAGAPLGDGTLGATFSTLGPQISGPLPFHANPIRGTSPC
jgi:phage tail-like protein